MPAPDVPGLITADEIRTTSAHIADWQLPSGMIPWFPGGHADPWNHVEAAMALAIGEHRAEAELAYQWLVDIQRPDGSWHQYYLEHEVEQELPVKLPEGRFQLLVHKGSQLGQERLPRSLL